MILQCVNPDVLPDINRIIRYASERVSQIAGFPILLQPVNALTPKDEAGLKAMVSNTFQISWEKISSKSRAREIVAARQSYCYLCRKIFPRKTLVKIAEEVNYNDHTDVIHAVKTVEAHIDTKDQLIMPRVHFILQIFNHEA